MMGRSHAEMGAVFGLGTGIAVTRAIDIPPAWLALGVVLAAGFSVINDLDHPDSAVANCMGPISRGLAWAVCKMSGGHRNGTHSALGSALFTVAGFASAALFLRDVNLLLIGVGIGAVEVASGWGSATALNNGRRPRRAFKKSWYGWFSAIVIAILGGGLLLAATTFGHLVVGGILVFSLIVLSLSALIRVWLPLRRLLNRLPGRFGDEAAPYVVAAYAVQQEEIVIVVPYALALGVLVHIAGDMATVQGCPWSWPWSQKQVRLPVTFVTNSKEEAVLEWVFRVCFVVLLGVQIWSSSSA